MSDLQIKTQTQAGAEAQAPQCPVYVRLGRKTLTGERARDLQAGALVELDDFADDYVEVIADGCLIARGTPLVVDGKLAVRVQEAIGQTRVIPGKFE